MKHGAVALSEMQCDSQPAPVFQSHGGRGSDLSPIPGDVYHPTVALDAGHLRLRPTSSPCTTTGPTTSHSDTAQNQQQQTLSGDTTKRSLLGKPRPLAPTSLPATSRFTIVATQDPFHQNMHASDPNQAPAHGQHQQVLSVDSTHRNTSTTVPMTIPPADSTVNPAGYAHGSTTPPGSLTALGSGGSFGAGSSFPGGAAPGGSNTARMVMAGGHHTLNHHHTSGMNVTMSDGGSIGTSSGIGGSSSRSEGYEASPPSSTGTSLGSLRAFSNLTLMSDAPPTAASSTLRSSLDSTTGFMDPSIFSLSLTNGLNSTTTSASAGLTADNGTNNQQQQQMPHHSQLARIRVPSRLSSGTSSSDKMNSSPASQTVVQGTTLKSGPLGGGSNAGNGGSVGAAAMHSNSGTMSAQDSPVYTPTAAAATTTTTTTNINNNSCGLSPTGLAHTNSNAAAAAAGLGRTTSGVGLSAGPGAGKIPMYSAEGRVIGYRQDSSVMRPFLSYCIPPSPAHGGNRTGTGTPTSSAFGALFSSTSLDTGSPKYTSTSHPQHPLLASKTSSLSRQGAADLVAMAAQPFKGFPNEANQVPGYVLGSELGRGGFCVVKKGLHEPTGQIVAVKIIDKVRLKDPKDLDRVQREMRVMRHVAGHVAIAQLLECVETADYLYLVMEHCPGGSLLDYVRRQKRLPEPKASLILQQLLYALQYCHFKCVVHRDIKLENVLLDAQGVVKLIDFGLSGYYVPGKKLKCHCGSPSYAAPEMVSRHDYEAPAVDVWSLGVVLFACLAGHLPFYAKDKKDLSLKILSGTYKVPSSMSPLAQDLISKMLTLDPLQRITLEEIWKHPWVASHTPTWAPNGKGPKGLLRHPVDDTGALLLDAQVLDHLQASGVDIAAVIKALRNKECGPGTTHYHLLCHVKTQALLELEPNQQNQQQQAHQGNGVIVSDLGHGSVQQYNSEQQNLITQYQQVHGVCAMERSSSGGSSMSSDGTVHMRS